ncbi:btb/poz domain-containing protein [Anaeramoeba flamelloides]|uniref:Btb/poz domain-containing protein n=1 Tax=Anaeramoeba flamelloides TaxID=1746091 RepID=A0AAV7Z4M0_9EUKA|nr:btb/poz domain-containing protein [Anaeramoeba flamelloides]
MSLRHFQSVISTFKFDSELSDVIFLIGANKKKYPSHRLVFAVTSPFWETLFYPKNWRSLREEQSVVTLKDVSPSTWNVINEFVYQNTTRALNKSNLVDVIDLSKTFQMKKLLQICISFQIKHYSLDELLMKLKQIDIENEISQEFEEQNHNKDEKKRQKQKKNEKKKGGNFQKTNSTNNTRIENGNEKEKEKEMDQEKEIEMQMDTGIDQVNSNNENQIEIENGNEKEKEKKKEKEKENEKEKKKQKENEKENQSKNRNGNSGNLDQAIKSLRRKEILKCVQNNLYQILQIEQILIPLRKETLLELFSNNSLDSVPPILFFRRLIERGKHLAIQFDLMDRKQVIMDFLKEFLHLVDLSKCTLNQLLEIKSSALIDQNIINQRLNDLIEKKQKSYKNQILTQETLFFPHTFEKNYFKIESDRKEIFQCESLFEQFKEEEKHPVKLKRTRKNKIKKKKLVFKKRGKSKKATYKKAKQEKKAITTDKRSVLSHKYQFRNKKKRNYNLDNLSYFYNHNEITNLYHKKKKRKSWKTRKNSEKQNNYKKKRKRQKKGKKWKEKEKEKEKDNKMSLDKINIGSVINLKTSKEIKKSFRDFEAKEPQYMKVLFVTSENNKSRVKNICESIKANGIEKVVTSLNTTPTIQELKKYDAIVVCIQAYSTFDDLELLSDRLSKYVEGGGGVVLSTVKSILSNVKQNVNTFLEGKFAKQLMPLKKSKHIIKFPAKLGKVFYPDHPIMQGVNSFNGGLFATRAKTKLVKIKHHLNRAQFLYTVANWDDGSPLISVRNVSGYGKVVILNFSLASGLAYSKPTQKFYWDHETDGDKIIANSVRWVAGL